MLPLVQASGYCQIELSEADTAALLKEIHVAYHTQINDVLLAALSLSMKETLGVSDLLLHLEGHGREEVLPAVDVSRTTGWFTSLFPVRLQLTEAVKQIGEDRFSESLIAVKESLRTIPQKGIGYGLLRYLSEKTKGASAAEKAQWSLLDAIPVSFNYLGQWDASLNEGNLWKEAKESAGLCVAESNATSHLIDINGGVSGKRLRMSFSYSKAHYEEETIERLSQAYKKSLQGLISHCKRQAVSRYTPSDFPLATLSRSQLAGIEAKAPKLVDIYPLSPLQAGLLFHALYAPESDQYVTQMYWDYRGKLNPSALREAWQGLLDQHGILRTRFIVDGVDAPVQVVETGLSLPWRLEDWSETEQQGKNRKSSRRVWKSI